MQQKQWDELVTQIELAGRRGITGVVNQSGLSRNQKRKINDFFRKAVHELCQEARKQCKPLFDGEIADPKHVMRRADSFGGDGISAAGRFKSIKEPSPESQRALDRLLRLHMGM